MFTGEAEESPGFLGPPRVRKDLDTQKPPARFPGWGGGHGCWACASNRPTPAEETSRSSECQALSKLLKCRRDGHEPWSSRV